VAEPAHQARYARVKFGPFCLSAAERLLTRDGNPVEIGGRSFDLLAALVEQPGRVLSKRELLKRVWSDVVVEDGSLRFHMAGLRKLLGDGQNGARYIATQVGVGYAFVAPIELREPAHGTVEQEWAAPERPPARALADAPNMPSRLPHLIGRDTDLRLLTDRIVDTPLFTVVGPAGVGKTTLAIEIAHRLVHRFDDHVTFVDFSLLEDPALVPQMIAGAMGLAVHSDDPLAVILGYIREKKILLLLDNCEHVIEAAAAIVERIIDGAPDARILATSREPMRIRGEHVHRLDALAYPDEVAGLSLEELLSYPAVQLFCERAAAGDSALRVDEDSARLIAGMCSRLDGMALPIELAAVRVASHGIPATARLIGEKFSLGWRGRRTASPRQQTLQAALDWSYDLLSHVERRVFERLAVFVGLFSIDAALEVAADEEIGTDQVAAALDGLTSKSLVVPQRSGGTYRLLEMTRAYAREKLLSRGTEEYRATARRHAGFFLGEIDAAAAQDAEALHDAHAIRQQLGNIRSALEWSFGPDGDKRIAVGLAAASARVFLNLSSLVECRTWCARAIAELQDPQLDTAVELELQAALGTSLMFTRGNSQAAGAALSRALDVATALEDRWNQLRILGRLHIFHERIGEYAVASSHAERAVRVAEAIGEPEAIGIASSLSGISLHLAGDQARARQALETSLEKSAPSHRSRTIHYGFDHRNRSGIGLARALWLTGRSDQALRVARQTVREAASLDHPVTHCIALIWSFSVHLWTGELDQAEKGLEAFAQCAEVNALGPYIAAVGGLRGELEIERGRSGDALGALEESLSRLRSSHYELLTTPFSLALSRGLILEGRFQEARDLVDATIDRCEANGERFAIPELLRVKADIARTSQDFAASETLLTDALALSRKQGALAWELRAAIDLAALPLARERRDETLALLAGIRARFPAEDATADVRKADMLLALPSP